MASSSQSQTALKTFDLTNSVQELTPEEDLIYRFDAAEDRQIKNASPWSKDPHYFKKCRISAVALIKMVTHARSGGIYEIMGLMQGKVVGDSMVIMDAFALPVQGTETRVNAANEANEFMVQFLDGGSKIGRPELAIGWYHSHPGYGCWLSGIDVSTQSTNQKYQDPFVAVVIDPNRTISAGKVDIGAFRTYPEGYTPPNASSNYQSIPLSKIEDFGVHADSYYPLEVSIFKSSLDKELLGLLWNKYWVNTLSQSPLISNRAYAVSQLNDLAAKVQKAQSGLASSRSGALAASLGGGSVSNVLKMKDGNQAESQDSKGGDNEKDKDKVSGTKKEGKKNAAKEETAMEKAVKDSTRIAAEAQHGLIAQVLKDVIFSMRPRADNAAVAAAVSAATDTVMTT